MSQVTSVILTTAAGEIDIDAFNELWEFDGAPEFADHAPISAGDKHLECNVYLGAFNYLNLAAFVATIKKVEWSFPNEVQLFVQEHNSVRFREVGLWERGE